jgi:hypothetical protein
MDSPRISMHSRVVYQRKMPIDMKEKKTVRSRRPKDGAPQMSNGKIGEDANFDSQSANPTIWTIETMSSA